MLAQVQLQGASEQFQQHLEAGLGDGRVVPALAELISDKGIYVTVRENLSIERKQKIGRTR